MDEEELEEEIVENIIEIIESYSYTNDYDDELVYVNIVIEAIKGHYGL